MPITVNTNMSSLICQRSLNKATNGMNTALQRMSTGLRINSSKDDAAGMAISSKMDTKLSSYSVAQDNVQMGQSMLDTASGSIDTMTSMLQRMRDLSEQAANGTYGAEERKAMQAEVDALTSEIYRIKNTTEFNGKKILGEEQQPKSNEIVTDIKMSDININTVSRADIQNKIIGINSREDLEKIATIVNNKGIDTTGVTFALTKNIDLSGKEWTAIGNSTTLFKGNFNGNGFTINGLTINKPSGSLQGLFGNIQNANINNVKLTGVNITVHSIVGGLIGQAIDSSTINDCSVEGKIKGNNDSTGGLIGKTLKSNINNCTTSGEIIGGVSTGGLIGYNSQSNVSNCFSSGSVTATLNQLGGLVGYNIDNSEIKNCSSSMTVTGTTSNFVGGVVGMNHNGAIINNCSSSGTITGNIRVGGIVGRNGSPTINSWTTSKVVSSSGGGGAIAGSDSNHLGTFSNNFYDQTINVGMPAINGLVSTPDQAAHKAAIDMPPAHGPVKPTHKVSNTQYNLQVGINNDTNSVLSINTGFTLGDFKIELKNEDSAKMAIDTIDKMLATITNKSLDLGATQNRLDSIKEFQGVQMSALTSASSLIKDADIAKESASYIKNQILQQTTATLLATANQNPSIALSLV